MLAYEVPRTKDVGLPTEFRLNLESESQPIAGSMPVNRLRRWPNTNPSLDLLILCANTWHSLNAVSMLTHSLRRWPGIETAVDYAGDAIHWPKTDVMLGHGLRRWANIIPIRTL